MGFAKLCIAALVLAVSAGVAQSQAWPQRPVTIVVPFAAGGNSDTIARILGQRLGERFGQPFVVENRAGAGGVIAAEVLAHATADGYTLLMASPSQISIAPVMTKVRYDPVADLAPIGIVGVNPLVLMVHAGVPARTAAELVAYVRERPHTLSYGTAGPGSIAHLTAAMYAAGIRGVDCGGHGVVGGRSQNLRRAVAMIRVERFGSAR